MAINLALYVAALGSLIVGGVFYAFSTFVMKALGQLPPLQGAAAMNAMSVTVINPLFMSAFIGTAILSMVIIGYAALGSGRAGTVWMFAASLTYLFGSFGVTMLFNVPLNEQLAGAAPANIEHVWNNYLLQWTSWNHVRTVLSLVAGALFLRAAALQLQS